MAKRNLDDIDRALIGLLRGNARLPIATLGRKVGLSRSAAQERLRRLEAGGFIAGYTLILGREGQSAAAVSAHVHLTLDPKQQDRAFLALKGLPEVTAAYTVSGPFDAIALIQANGAAHLDEVLTRIGKLPGINRTVSAILLTTMIERG